MTALSYINLIMPSSDKSGGEGDNSV